MQTRIPLRGLYECIGSLVEFVEVYPASNLIPAPPRFTFGTFGADLATMFFRHTHLWAIGLYRLSGFEVFGAYALCKDGELFSCHEANIHSEYIAGVVAALGAPTLPRTRRFLAGPFAMITGPGHGIYGHWLSDFLPKLYLLHAAGYDIRRLRYLLPSDTPSFGHLWLRLLGIPPENITLFDPNGELVWVEELLVPTTVHNGVRASSVLKDAAAFLLSLIADHAGEPLPTSAHRRVFVSRARAPQTRALQNRSQIEEIAVTFGLELVYPEALPLIEQVHLFGEANLIVGEYGSALHGSLFSGRGTTICALRGSLGHPGFIQSGFGQSLGQPTGYVFGEPVDEAGDGRFTISGSDFEQCLHTLFGAPGFESF